MGWPLKYLQRVNPFKIDALGIVTLLGADEVNNSVGRLVRSRYLEYLPLLGAYVFAGDAFAEKQPGFQLYNVSTGIFTSDLAGWMTRWMMAQGFHLTCSKVTWTMESIPHSFKLDDAIALVISVVLNAGFIALTLLMEDWWGFANAISMTASIIVRFVLVQQRRAGLDLAVMAAKEESRPDATPVQIIVILSDSKAIYMEAPEALITRCFVATPAPPRPHLYELFKWIGWVSFGGHVISIGMSVLVTQLITVGLIVVPTIAMVWQFGCNEQYIGTLLNAKQTNWASEADEPGRRIDLYAYLQLDEDAETSLKKWDLTPHERSSTEAWWRSYQDKKDHVYALEGDARQRVIHERKIKRREDKARQDAAKKAARSSISAVTSGSSTQSGANGAVHRPAPSLSGDAHVGHAVA